MIFNLLLFSYCLFKISSIKSIINGIPLQTFFLDLELLMAFSSACLRLLLDAVPLLSTGSWQPLPLMVAGHPILALKTGQEAQSTYL